MDKDYSKLDPESRRQMVIIDLQLATDKNAKELEALKAQLAQVVDLCSELPKALESKYRILEERIDNLSILFDTLNKQVNKPAAEKPKEVNLLEVIKNLFKRK